MKSNKELPLRGEKELKYYELIVTRITLIVPHAKIVINRAICGKIYPKSMAISVDDNGRAFWFT